MAESHPLLSLIFQFGYLRIHMNDKELQEIVVYVAEIFKTFYSTHLYEICSKMAEAK